MKRLKLPRSLTMILLLLGLSARAVVFTNNFAISPVNSNYDGLDIVVSNGVLTVDGSHSFGNLRIAAGATLTHSASPSGSIPVLVPVLDEPQILAGTNADTLGNSNIVTASVLVNDSTGLILYTNSVDYVLTTAGAMMLLQRTVTSSIPDGAMVLVSYSYSVGTTNAGLNITLTGNLEVEPAATIQANKIGYGGAFGTGHGTSTGSILDGSGGGYGGYGGMSSSNAPGGGAFGSFTQPSNLGGAGGSGVGGYGGSGGGAIQITAAGNMILNGILSANGENATNNRAGGGAGGSIWLTAAAVSGSGSITANGGAGEPIHGGGGGGGRIAVQCNTDTFAGSVAALGGSGWKFGGAGTIYTAVTGQNGLLLSDNGGHSSTNTLAVFFSTVDVIIQNGAGLAASGPLTFGNLLVASNAILTTANPVTVTTLNATGSVTVLGSIVFDGAGYGAGGGPGAGHVYSISPNFPCGGGAHGGNGAAGSSTNASGGIAYDSTTSPTQLGSGGGSVTSSIGGPGGGALRLNVTGNLLVSGSISANGINGGGIGGGGGAGGSIWITAGTLSGSGSIVASGGNGSGSNGGGGGGGRIALFPTSNSFSGSIVAVGGGGANWGGAGSVFIQNTGQNPQVIVDNGGHLGASTLAQPPTGADLTLRNNAVVNGSYPMNLGNLSVGSAAMLVPSSPTATLSVTATGAVIQAGGAISADGWGYAAGQGPGAGRAVSENFYPNYVGSGGGHGGFGGFSLSNAAAGGGTYDLTSSPTSAGSGGGLLASGGPSGSGAGGGVIRLTVNGALQLNGKISANGAPAAIVTGFGGGAGGAVWLTLGSLSGSGSINANGGAGGGIVGGGGGGGRVAVSFNSSTFTGAETAYAGGGAFYGGAGTVFVKSNFQFYASLLVDNGGNPGTNTTFDGSPSDLTIQGGGIAQWPGSGSLRNLIIRTNSTFTTINSGAFQTINLNGNATIDAGGALSVDGAGFGAGGGTGAGGSSTSMKGGGGHGGTGGNNLSGGIAYDSITAPAGSGSGGASGSGTTISPLGGAGGGGLGLTVIGPLVLNGRISANGRNGDVNSGGGSGGGLNLTLGTVSGNGSITANGGSGNGIGGGGGGGRVAFNYISSTFTGPISAFGGAGAVPGGAGTVYVKSRSASSGRLTIDNGGLTGTNTPLSSTLFSLGLPTAPFDLMILNGAFVSNPNPLPLISNLTISSGSTFAAGGRPTNVTLAVIKNLNVASGGTLTVAGIGFAQGAGPGAGASLSNQGAGGGYGGVGGASTSGAPGGTNYGSASQPTDRGSGGGAGADVFTGGSDGGGALRVSVGGTMNIDGWLAADGNPGLQDDSGGGSGGSIWITAGAITGAGLISADGGAGDPYNGGGGGGGRIALYSPTNAFTGLITTDAGTGANPGQPGTSFTSAFLPGFTVIAQSPTGTVNSAVSFVDLSFNDAIDMNSVTAAEISVVTPSGPISSGNLTFSNLSVSTVRVSFPQQTGLGQYSISAGPDIRNIFGTSMGQVYSGTFSVLLPAIRGVVTDTNGAPVAGVSMQPTGGQSPATTDATGAYAVGVINGWTGSISPVLSGAMFIPGTRYYTNVVADVTNENYVMVSTIAATLGAQLSDTNFSLQWNGLQGVNYQAFWSTNLTDWMPYGGQIPGSNGVMQLLVPVSSQPEAYFRMQSAN